MFQYPLPPEPTGGAPKAALAIAFSALSFVLAGVLLVWVMSARSPGNTQGQPAKPSPIAASTSQNPTTLAILPAATSTVPPLLPTSTIAPPTLPTSTPQIIAPTVAPLPPTSVAAVPTLTSDVLPFTGTPPPTSPPAAPPPVLPSETAVSPAAPPTKGPAPPKPAAPKPARPVIVDVPYVVRAGDTLSGLAVRYHTSVVAIMRRNGLRSTAIYIGEHLIIPDP